MTTPPAAPTDEGPRTEPPPPPDSGPRVSADELRDLGRMRRTRGERKLAGVAGGIARHVDIDPIIVRVTLVVLAFFGGAGLLIYLVCWLIVPADDTGEATVRLDHRSRTVALFVVGGLATLALLGDSLGGWGFPWPLAILGVVVLAVVAARNRDRDEWARPQPTPDAPTWSASTPLDSSSRATRTARGPRRRGPILFWYAVLVIAIGIGVLGMVDLAGADVADSAYPAVALATCGVFLVLGAFWGRAGGLILLGLLSALATAAGTVATEIDAGHLDEKPVSAALVRSDYRYDAGEIELDLTDVADLDALDGRTLTLAVDFGRVAVVLPRDLDVTVTSSVEVGHRSIDGDESNGDSGTDEITGEITGGGDDGKPAATTPHLTLDIDVTFGEIEVTQEGRSR